MYGRKITEHLRPGTPLHLYLPGPHHGVWNEEALSISKEIILCESLIDALTFWCAGFRNVTTAYGVEGFTSDHLAALKKHQTSRVLIAYDRDDAGDKAAEVKALVNMVMNANTAALAEGLGLGAALGLDLTILREVFSQTGARSGVLQTDGEDMQNREHSCFFSAAHAAKDSGIALKLAKEQGLNLPLATATKKQYDRMIKEGLGELDKSGIAELTFKGRHQPTPA